MKKHFLHYFTDSLFSINSREEHQQGTFGALEFKFGFQDKVIIRDSIVEIDSVKCFIGLDCYVSISAVDGETAKNGGKIYIETILNLMSFSTIAYSNAAYLQSMIEIHDVEESNYLFEYFVHKNVKNKFPIERALRKIEPSILKAVWDGWDKITDGKVKSRINRAISWLRKGLLEHNIDEFIAYFIGLEILSGCLNEKLSIKYEVTIWNKIRSFITGRKYSGTDWSGLEKTFKDHSLGVNFKDLKKKRNEIFHGYKKLDVAFVKEINQLIPELRKTLIIVISILLDVDPQTINSQKYTKPVFERWDILKGHFSEFTDDIENVLNCYPKINGWLAKQALSIDGDGNLQASESWKYDFICEEGHKFHISECQSWAENDSGIKKMQITRFNEEDV